MKKIRNKLVILAGYLALTSSSFANICQVDSYVFVPDREEPWNIFSAPFEIATMDACLDFTWTNIHLRLLGPDYDRTIVTFYLGESRIPFKRIVMDKNYKLK